MLETLGRIAEEQGMHDEDDDSFDEEGVFLTQSESIEGRESGSYFNRDESMGTEGSASIFVMGEDEESYGYPRERDGSSFDDSQSTDHASMQYARRGSHSSRRSSFVSEDSAATSGSGNSPRASPSIEKQRSSSGARQRRRQSINLTSVPADAFSNVARSEKLPPKTKTKSMRPLSRLSKLGPSNRRAGAKMDEQETTVSDTRSAFMTLGQMGNTELEDAAAAAAVVALTEGASATKRIQYVVDDLVLVLLNILNLTNSVDPPDAFTVMPVNQYGFPPGEGHRSSEQQGPYVYVLATVKRVHYDEDVPYYTVIRADTLAEQRADVGESLAWEYTLMMPLDFLSQHFFLAYSMDGAFDGPSWYRGSDKSCSRNCTIHSRPPTFLA